MTVTSHPRHRLPGRTVQAAAGLGVAAVVAMIVALFAAGGAPDPDPLGLAEPGPAVEWALPVLRLVADLAAVACVGALLTSAVLLPAPNQGRLGFRGRWAVQDAAMVAAVWALAALAGAVVTAAVGLAESVSGVPSRLGEAATLPQVRALAVSAVLAATVAAVVSGARARASAAIGLFLAVVALSVPLLTGHSATDDLPVAATAARVLHVIGATLWIGGLASLVRYGRGSGPALPVAVARFSRLALGCAVVVGLSGAGAAGIHLASVNGGGAGDAIAALVATAYGGVVLAKASVFALLVVAGWWHRRWILPRLADRFAAFWQLAAVELLIMGAAVGLAVALSRTP